MTYAPYLLEPALIDWAKNDYDPAKLPDVEALAYRNIDLEKDLNLMLIVSDFHNTPRK